MFAASATRSTFDDRLKVNQLSTNVARMKL